MCVFTLHVAPAWPADARCVPQRTSRVPRPLRCAAPRSYAAADAGAAPDDAAATSAVAEDSPLSAALRGWRLRHTLRDGTAVLLRPASVAESPALVEMLADGFATSMRAPQYRHVFIAGVALITACLSADAFVCLLPLRSKFLGRQVATYITARLATPPEQAALIVAVPTEAGDGDATAADVPLLGFDELSLSARTHGRFDDASIAPPPHAPFVKNVLSSPHLRRRGVAAALLAGVEDYAAVVADASGNAGGPLELFLHCGRGDAPAASLYAAAGYTTVVQQNGVLAALRRSAPPLALMRKRLRPR